MGEEDMAAQLKALTELVQQLQADISRLGEEVTWMSAPTPGGSGPSGNSTGQATTSASPDQMRIVLLGKTGDGKSSSWNTILGDSSSTKFKTKSSPTSVTGNCEVQMGTRAGKQIKIIDTPGFFDTHMSEEELLPEILKCITLTSPGPHAFIIVLRVERFTEQEKATVAKITKFFGEDAFKYSAVLFTHGDDLDGQTIEQFVDQSKELKELVEKCGGGCHVIDNKYWNQEHEYRSNSVQVEKLLNTIEEMVRQNGGGCYTNEMLQAVEEAIQSQEEEIRKENPNEKSAFKIRAQATGRFIKKIFVKCAGLTAGALVGAFLGVGVATVAAYIVAGFLIKGGAVAAAAEDIRWAAATGLCVAGVNVAVIAAAGAIGGGIVGFQAVEDGDGVCGAVKKAVRANVDNAKYVVKGLVSEVKEVLDTPRINESRYKS